MDPALERLVERRLLSALSRLHRRDPLRADVRVDAVIAELRSDPAEQRPAGHRGSGSLRGVPDAALLQAMDALVSSGAVERRGRHVRRAGHEAAIADRQMASRVETLLAGLRELGADVPRVEGVAARLGIPPGVIEQMRAAGVLVRVADGIDYPSDVLRGLLDRIGALAESGPLTMARVRSGLHASRRTAEALLAYRRAQRQRSRSRIGNTARREGPPS
jgi:hypothetical protein